MNEIKNVAEPSIGCMEKQEPQPLTWNPELTRRFWNYYSRFPELYFTEQFGGRILDVVLPLLGTSPRVLDYACGTGGLTGQMLDRGVRVTACDISPDSLDLVNGNYAGWKNFLGGIPVAELASGGGGTIRCCAASGTC